MIFIFLFVIFGFSGIYVAKRLHKGLAVKFPKLRFWAVLAVILFAVFLMTLSFFRSFIPFSGGIKTFIGTVSAYTMGVYIYLLLYTAVCDILTLVMKLFKARFVKKERFPFAVTCAVFILTGVTVVYGCINARDIEHVPYEIDVDSKTDVSDMNIVMISDVHLGSVGSESRLSEIVSEINSQKPDIVCIAGDFFDTDYGEITDPEAAVETMKKIKSTHGVYACLGNHDAGKTTSKMQSFFEKANVTLLCDEFVVIDNRLVLAGRLDSSPIGGTDGMQRKPMNEYFDREQYKDLPVVVLDHNPKSIDTYGNEADLVLSGHTHKGQMFPAGILTDLMYSEDYGCYRKDANSPHLIVTSGIGYWGMPMRVGTQSEIVSVTIK